MSYENAITYSKRWMDIIQNPNVSDEEGKQIIDRVKIQFCRTF